MVQNYNKKRSSQMKQVRLAGTLLGQTVGIRVQLDLIASLWIRYKSHTKETAIRLSIHSNK